MLRGGPGVASRGIRGAGQRSCPGRGAAGPAPVAERDPQRGSAVAEFVMVSAVLMLLFMACLQIGFALHVRNTVQDASSTGARYGALRDRTPQDGAARTREILSSSLPQRYAQDVRPSVTSDGAQPVLEITVSAPLPVLGPWGPAEGIEVSGHAILP